MDGALEVPGSIPNCAATSFRSDPNALTTCGLLQKRKERYNIIAVHSDDGSVGAWKTEANLEEMRHKYEGFDPR